jgi:hypothetical protein
VERTALRTIRITGEKPRIPSAMVMYLRLGLSTTWMISRRRIRAGKAWRASTKRWMIMSIQPPK